MNAKMLITIPALLTAGCGAHCRVDLVNTTSNPVEIRVAHVDSGYEDTSDQPRATVAPGGRFDYRVFYGGWADERYASVLTVGWPATSGAKVEVGNCGSIHGLVELKGDRLVITRCSEAEVNAAVRR